MTEKKSPSLQGPRPLEPRRGGFALISTLLLLSAVTILVVAYFTLASSETIAARSFAHDHRAQLAALAGFEEAKAVIAEMTQDDEYLVTSIPNKSTYVDATAMNSNPKNDGDPDDDSQNRYFFISRPNGDQPVGSASAYEHIPLYSGARIQTTSIHEGPRWDQAENTSLEMARGVIGGLRQFGLEDDDFYVDDTDGSGTVDSADEHSERNFLFKAYTFWVPKDTDGDGVADIRYTWWVEDLEGLPQFDKIGNIYSGGSEGNNLQFWNTFQHGGAGHEANTQADARNQAHYDTYRLGSGPYDARLGGLGTNLDQSDNYRLPSYVRNDALEASANDRRGIKFVERSYNPGEYVHDPDARDIPRQDFFVKNTSSATNGLAYPNGQWTPQMATGLSTKEMRSTARWGGGNGYYTHSYRERKLGRMGGILSSDSAGVIQVNRQSRSSYGVRPYAMRPMIPRGFGYRGAQVGDVRFNLNDYTDKDDVTSLFTILQSVLPERWGQRGGAFVMDNDQYLINDVNGESSVGSSHAITRQNDYLRALATNMVDYVDEDNDPTIQSANGSDLLGTGLTRPNGAINPARSNWDRPRNRGIDGYPVVNEFALQIHKRKDARDGPTLSGPAGTIQTWIIELEFTPHVEFWNPTNQVTDSDLDLGLIWWETAGDGSGHIEDVMLDYRIRTQTNIPVYMKRAQVGSNGTAHYLNRILRNGADVSGQSDLITWKEVGQFQPNQYKAFTYPTITYELIVAKNPDGDASKINLFFQGERLGVEMNGSFDGKYMVLRRVGSSDQQVSDHQLIDQSGRGMDRKGSGTQEQLNESRKFVYSNNGAGHGISTFGSSSFRYNPGDPYMAYWMWGSAAEISFGSGSSFGGRNYRRNLDHTGGTDNDNVDLTLGWPILDDRDDHPGAEIAVERWPDGGYNTERGTLLNASQDYALNPLSSLTNNGSDQYGGDGKGYTTEDSWSGGETFDPRGLAPYRLNNTGRWWAISELGNVYDPIMWNENAQKWTSNSAWTEAQVMNNGYRQFRRVENGRIPHNQGGGGNTLRIGRPEHPKFRRDLGETEDNNLHAAMLLDIFHVGTNGSNVGSLPPGKENEWNPAFHIDPPTARNQADATNHPYRHVWGEKLHAESDFRYINGHININSAHDIEALWFLTDGPYVMDSGYGIDAPARSYGGIQWESQGSHRDTVGGLRTRLWRGRPFYAPSQIANILYDKGPRPDLGTNSTTWPNNNFELGTWQNAVTSRDNPGPDGVNNSGDETFTTHRTRQTEMPASDPLREEAFARIINMSSLSSRNFRIHVMGEYLNNKGEPIAASRKVYEVFSRPIRDASGAITEVKIESLSERDL